MAASPSLSPAGDGLLMPDPFERHARSKWEWGTPGARSQEVQAAAADDPEPPKRGPARKNTRDWCKGKVGVEHVPHLVWHPVLWRRGEPDCRWRAGWDSRTGGESAYWACDHREECERCGKVLRDRIPAAECPAYPGTSEDHAAAEAEAARIREQIVQRPSRRKVITGPQGYRRHRG